MHFLYSVRSEMEYTTNLAGALALIKRSGTLDSARSLQSQLQILNLPGPAPGDENVATVQTTMTTTDGETTTSTTENPYEMLHAVIHHAVRPYFDAFAAVKSKRESLLASRDDDRTMREKRLEDRDAKTGIPMAKKKIAELELSLLHLQQNAEIPEIVLPINTHIQKVINEV